MYFHLIFIKIYHRELEIISLIIFAYLLLTLLVTWASSTSASEGRRWFAARTLKSWQRISWTTTLETSWARSALPGAREVPSVRHYQSWNPSRGLPTSRWRHHWRRRLRLWLVNNPNTLILYGELVNHCGHLSNWNIVPAEWQHYNYMSTHDIPR